MDSPMRPFLLLPLAAVVTLAAAPAPAPAPFLAPAKPDARKRDAADDAIDRGLDFLRTAQSKDGSWGNPGAAVWGGGGIGRPAQPGRTPGDIAITSLAVMAFLSAGHVPGEGHYGPVVENGIDWVLAQQQPDGRLAPSTLPGSTMEMYYHGIATLMLAEVVGLTRQSTADKLKAALERAVTVILAGQRKAGGAGGASAAGGWRYMVSTTGGFAATSDLSVTGWQLMALRSAKNVGCDVPAKAITDAVEYVKRSFDTAGPTKGGFRYEPNGAVTIPCTAVGVLCLELSGKEQHLCDEALHGGAYLLKHPLKTGDGNLSYGVYYVSQALFQLGGNYWETYRPKLHDLLLRQAPPNANGGWSNLGIDGQTHGSAYSTAMAVLSLTVEYRFLPIYQRFEEPLERDGRE